MFGREETRLEENEKETQRKALPTITYNGSILLYEGHIMNIILIGKDEFERMGSGSLVGKVATRFPPSLIAIQFEQTTFNWRKANGGPEEIIVPEYLPMCLCADIVELIRLGYKLTIGEYPDTRKKRVEPGSVDPKICKHPNRNMNGGCDDCGDPCL